MNQEEIRKMLLDPSVDEDRLRREIEAFALEIRSSEPGKAGTILLLQKLDLEIKDLVKEMIGP